MKPRLAKTPSKVWAVRPSSLECSLVFLLQMLRWCCNFTIEGVYFFAKLAQIKTGGPEFMQKLRLLLAFALLATSLLAVQALAMEANPAIHRCCVLGIKTSTTLAAPASVPKGEKLTLTATVKPAKNVGYFLANVIFYSETKEIGKSAMVLGKAKFSISDLPEGTHVLWAEFDPRYKAVYGPSKSKDVTVVVKKPSSCNCRSAVEPASAGR